MINVFCLYIDFMIVIVNVVFLFGFVLLLILFRSINVFFFIFFKIVVMFCI